MGGDSRIPWEEINEFLLCCGNVHEPYKFCLTIMENIKDLISFDEGLFFMLDGNRRIARRYFMGISRKWSSTYLEYYSRFTNSEYGLDLEISEHRAKPFTRLIDWESFLDESDEFLLNYIKPRGLSSSLAFVLFDLNGAPATAFSLDRTRDAPFTSRDISVLETVIPHLNNLYKNMFVRPSNQVSIWDRGDLKELTQREREVAELLCQGVTPANIARELHISVGTANKHIGHIYKKFGVGSRQELLVRMLGK